MSTTAAQVLLGAYIALVVIAALWPDPPGFRASLRRMAPRKPFRVVYPDHERRRDERYADQQAAVAQALKQGTVAEVYDDRQDPPTLLGRYDPAERE